jgi:uncharacterized protein YndB with AHSA1/START domain
MMSNLTHDTINIRRTISASIEQVFAAWADPHARAQWGAPSDDEVIQFVENDFRVGGKDVSLCGPKNDLRYRVESLYHDITKPIRLLFTELVTIEDTLLCVSLITVSLVECENSTTMDLTIQITSLTGEEMITGNRGGWAAALTNLEGYLGK